MEKKYQLLKDVELPTGKFYKGVIKSENNWMRIFPQLELGDCVVKKDWFKEIKGVGFNADDVISFTQHCLDNNIDVDDVISEFRKYFSDVK